MQLPEGARGPLGSPSSSRPTGTPSTRRSSRRAEVREQQHAHHRAALGDPAGRPDAALVAERHHPGAGPDGALGDLAAGRGERKRPPGVVGLDLNDAGIVQPAVVALGDHRDDDVLDPDRRLRGHGRRHGAVVDAADRHRRGEVDGCLEHSELHHLKGAGHLPGAVQDRDAGRHRLGPERLRHAGGDRGDTGSRDAPAGGRVRLVAANGHVAHAHPGHVRNRVTRAGVEHADADAVLARAPGKGHVPDPIRAGSARDGAGSRLRRQHQHARRPTSPSDRCC